MLRRDEAILVAAAWLVYVLAFLFVAGNAVLTMAMPDADDFLRLQQVRDWLGGQSWFDVSQHRINPPISAAMHWSRLVDVPLAFVIATLRPVVGEFTAERVAAVAIPMATLGVIMLLVATAAARLMPRNWCVVAAVAAPLSTWVYSQTMPLRVDHHGWQIVAAMTLLCALLDEERPRRSGIIAGAAGAVWMNISIEGLPVVACAGGLLVARWLMDKASLPRLSAFVWTLTGACVLLETATTASAWMTVECDRLSAPYALALGVLSVGILIWRLDWLSANWRARTITALATVGAAAGLFLLQGPACIAGPFGSLDPLTKIFWYDNVAESFPIWKAGLGAAIVNGGYALLGCGGAAFALSVSKNSLSRQRWLTVLVLCVLASALMAVISRAGGVAHAYSTLGATFVAATLFAHARAIRNVLIRVVASALALLAATPALLFPAFALDSRAPRAFSGCRGEFPALSALPPGLVFAPLDIGPEIIVETPHSVVATGHHRNHAAMHDVIAAFTGSEDSAHAQIKAHGARYVVICPTASETRLYQEKAPSGFAAQIVAGNVPKWLERVSLSPSNLKLLVYRVREGER